MQRIEDDSLMVHYELQNVSTTVMNAKVEAESSLCYIKALNYVSKVIGVNNNLQTGTLKKAVLLRCSASMWMVEKKQNGFAISLFLYFADYSSKRKLFGWKI